MSESPTKNLDKIEHNLEMLDTKRFTQADIERLAIMQADIERLAIILDELDRCLELKRRFVGSV